LERRGKSEASETRGSVNEEATANRPASSLPELSYIEETIACGAITIGLIPPLKECVAIAHEGRSTQAMLKRQKGESLTELLSRLNIAIALAHTEDIFTDEIIPRTRNVPSSLHPLISRRPETNAYGQSTLARFSVLI
jgi:hypothetical protein